MENNSDWPALNFKDLQPTLETLHQWIQIVGKIRLKTMPWQNHSWHAALYITSNGFSTQAIPYQGRIFQIDFDFKKHQLNISCSNKDSVQMELKPMTVASFYNEIFKKLKLVGVDIKIHDRPNEMEPAIPFQKNTYQKHYDPDQANKLWLAMLKTNEVFYQFRSQFIGKSSPVHLFWGAFDLAVTRFSGRNAPLHQGGMPNMPLKVMQEAYSKEVSSAGFWPGSKDFPYPIFYSYAYPGPKSFADQKVLPESSIYSQEMGEFILKYDDVRNTEQPGKTLYDFLQSTYEAAATTSHWDRENLELK